MLRAINVLGKRMIKMPDLVKLYRNMDLKDVQTYIQSGNVIFRTRETTANILAARIEQAILAAFGFNVAVLLRTPAELEVAISNNPFKNADGSAKENTYITFLENPPLTEHLEKIEKLSFLPDRYVIIGMEIFIDCAGGYGTTKLSNNFFENKLKVRATTRNWKTVKTLLDMAC